MRIRSPPRRRRPGRLKRHGVQAVLANPQAFAAMLANPSAFAAVSKQARRWRRLPSNQKALSAIAAQPNLAAVMANPSFTAALNQAGVRPSQSHSQLSRGLGGPLDGGKVVERAPARAWRAGARSTRLLDRRPSRRPRRNQPPPPPPADTTTVVEKPDAVPPQPEQAAARRAGARRRRPSPMRPSRTSPEHVPQDASGFHLSTLETKNLSLLYIDPIQTYLTPYLGRAFENALAFHKKEFHWKPWDRTTILLKDFSDYGNAAALGVAEQHGPARRRAACRCRWRHSRRASASSRSTTMSSRTSPRSTSGTRATPSGGTSSAASRRRCRSIRNRSSTIS